MPRHLGLTGLGFAVTFGSVVGFVLACVGPKSDLWWPDRPHGRFNPSPSVILAVGIPVGIALVVVGELVAH